MSKLLPFFSVIIPVYNAGKYLNECLNSITNQTFKNIEIICVNDCSSDDSLKILNLYKKKDERIFIINNKKNIGSGFSRNKAIQSAKGEYIAFLDSDDFVEKDWLNSIYNRIFKMPVDIIAFDGDEYTSISNKYGKTCFLNHQYSFPNECFSPNEMRDYILQLFSTATWGGIYNRKFLKEKQIKFGPFSRSDDQTFTIIARLSAHKIAIENHVFYHYRVDNSCSLSNSCLSLWKESFQAFSYTRNILLKKNLYLLFEKTILTCFIYNIEGYLIQRAKEPVTTFIRMYYNTHIHQNWGISLKDKSYFMPDIRNYIFSYTDQKKDFSEFQKIYEKFPKKIIPVVCYFNRLQSGRIVPLLNYFIKKIPNFCFFDIYVLSHSITNRMRKLIEEDYRKKIRVKYVKLPQKINTMQDAVSYLPQIIQGYKKILWMKDVDQVDLSENCTHFFLQFHKRAELSSNKNFDIIDLMSSPLLKLNGPQKERKKYILQYKNQIHDNDLPVIPKISIIMPVKTSAYFFKVCINSILKQKFSDFELICVCDGESECIDIVKKYSAQDDRIYPIYLSHRKGAANCRNLGLKIATGKYVLFLDSDDFFDPNLLLKLYQQAEYQQAEITICSAYQYNQSTYEKSIIPSSLRIQYTSGEVFSKETADVFKISSTCLWNKLYKLDFIKRYNLKFQSISSSNDTAFVLLSLLLAERITYVNNPLVFYRTNQLTNTTANRNIFNSLKVCQFILKKFRKYPELKKYRSLLETPFSNLLNYELTFSRKFHEQVDLIKRYLKFLSSKNKAIYLKRIQNNLTIIQIVKKADNLLFKCDMIFKQLYQNFQWIIISELPLEDLKYYITGYMTRIDKIIYCSDITSFPDWKNLLEKIDSKYMIIINNSLSLSPDFLNSIYFLKKNYPLIWSPILLYELDKSYQYDSPYPIFFIRSNLGKKYLNYFIKNNFNLPYNKNYPHLKQALLNLEGDYS